MATYIRETRCPTIGTERQHRLAAYLASKAGFLELRDALKKVTGQEIEPYETITVKRASQIIDLLEAHLDAEKAEMDRKTAKAGGAR